MKIALFADLHLDSHFAWAGPEAARKRRQNLRDTLVRIIDLACQERVDAICCAGDLYEHERVSPDTGDFLRSQFARVGNIPVFISPGNHDWFAPESLFRRVAWTPNVHIFTGSLSPVPLVDGLTLWGCAHQRPAGTPGFLEQFKVDRAGIHLALFHGSALGAFAEEGKQPHAPFRADDIHAAGLHYAMVGHYHAPRDEQFFCYPGNPDPLSFGENGSRGVVILSVQQDGRVAGQRHVVAVSKVTDVVVDVEGCTNKQQVLDRVAARLAGLDGFVKVSVHGNLDSSIDLQPGDLADLPTTLAAKPLVQLRTTPSSNFGVLSTEATVRGQFVRDVMAGDLPDDEKQRVLIVGLRALDGRDDLEVF